MQHIGAKIIVIFAVAVLVIAAAFLLPLLLNRSAPNQSTITKNDFDENPLTFRQEMRDWVILISTTAKTHDKDFIIIPQNCAPLLTSFGNPSDEVSISFIQSIDGIGQEGLTYGNDGYNDLRGSESLTAITSQIDIAAKSDLAVLSIDYCDTQNNINFAQQYVDARGYLGFQAQSIELIAVQPQTSANSNDIISLNQAQNFLALLNPEDFDTKESYLLALSETNYDVLIINAYFDEILTKDDLAQLRNKANGGTRLLISYLCIGEAEDYRYYWKELYHTSPPSWILGENPNWAGNYPVEYWNDEWQSIIATGENSYLSKIIAAGFDGVYLDIVDGYETFEDIYQNQD